MNSGTYPDCVGLSRVDTWVPNLIVLDNNRVNTRVPPLPVLVILTGTNLVVLGIAR